MVKFSNISKLWNTSKQDETAKDKKPEASVPANKKEGTPPEGQLKIPPVSQAREIEIKDESREKQPPQKTAEPIKYSDITLIPTPSQNPPAETKPDSEVLQSISPTKSGEYEDVTIPLKKEKEVIIDKTERLDLSRLRSQDDKGLQDASALYDKLCTTNQHTLNVINDKLPPSYINIKEIMQLVKETVASIQTSQALIDLTNRDTKENYLISHQVNVTLLSLAIGSGLGYNQTRLEELGLAAFLHDIGMQELLFLVENRKKLSTSEYEVVRNHIKIGIQTLQQIPELPSFVIDVCYQHHERLSGSGYLGITEGAIHEYAQIIGLTDAFESLIHHRSHHVAKTAQMALRELTELADTEFARKALKILIRKIGIYPVGTFVLLNTQEVAEVTKNNENFPLRPLVKIVYTSGDKLTSSKTLDLLANQSFYITATLTKEEALSKAADNKL